MRFTGSWLLTEFILVSSVFSFLNRLNEKGILGMGADFNATQLFWGNGIGMNVLKIAIITVFSGLFGFMYGYLSKKVSMSDKIIVSTLNSIMAVFFYFALMLIIFAFLGKTEKNEMHTALAFFLSYMVTSPLVLSFTLLQLIGSFVAGFYFVGVGINVISNPHYTLDKEKTGTLLDIKWYHYLWLSIPISIYSLVYLNLIYATGHTIITFIGNVRWYEFLGVTSTGDAGRSSIDIAWGNLFLIYIVGVIIFFALAYLRAVLTGKKQMHWGLKILVSALVGFVIPFILLFYRILG